MGMTARRFRAALLLAASAVLSACASGPDANLRTAIDIRLYDSDEQRLILHNATPDPIDILEGRNGSAKTLPGNGSMEIRFRVVSLESHLRVADEPYYFRTAGPIRNRIEEMDGRKYIADTPAVPVLYFRDSYGVGELPIVLDECDAPPANHWESKQWPTGTHTLEVPSRNDGLTQMLCPGS
jgi:hypothetical protein